MTAFCNSGRMKSLNLTVRDFKEATIFSQYGVTTFLTWCEKEAARINRGVKRDVAFVKQDGELCWVIRCDRAELAEQAEERE